MNNTHSDLLDAICRNIPDAICMIDRDWNIQSWNNGARIMFGYSADEILGKSLALIIPDDIVQQELDHCIGELNRTGKMTAYETVRRTRDGRAIPIELTAVVLKDDDGGIVGYASIMRDISERKRLENAVIESEANLRTVFNSTHDAIIIHDLHGKILDVNDRMLELYGLRYEEALQCGIEADLSAPENPIDIVRGIWEEVRAGGRRLFEWKARRPGDGSTFDAEVSLKRITLKRSDAILALVRDITEHKRAQHALKLMQFAVDHASICVYLIGLDARFLYVNAQACRTLGYTEQKMLSMTVHDIDPDFPPSVWGDHWAELKREGNLQFETRHRKKDGSLISLELSLNFLSFAGREYNVAFGLDISTRKKTEQELAKASRRNELILESAAEGIFGIDTRGGHTFVNNAGTRILGYDPAELIRRHSHPIWHHTRPDGTAYPEDECNIYKTLLDGISRQVDDEVFWKKDGTPMPVEYTTTPIREGADIVGTVVTFRDMTQRREAEQRIRESEEKYRSIVETSADWIWEMDLNGILTFNNPALEQILGYSPAELTGKDNFAYIYEEDRKKAEDILKKAIRERAGWKQDLLRWKHKDGSLRFIESNSVPVFDQRGALIGFRGSDRDVTEIKQAHAELQRAYEELEIKVEERTRELARTNEELRMEVTERKHAVDLIRKSKELSDALNALDTVIHSTLNVDEIMQRIVKQAAEALNVDASMIGSFDGDIFRVRYLHNMPDIFTGRMLTANELRAIHHVALAGEPLAFNDAYNDERLNIPFVREVGIRSLLVAPLFGKKKITGALTFYGLSRQIEFREEHVSFAAKLSASISLALENAGLYEALTESRALSEFQFAELKAIYETAPVGLCFIGTNMRYISINRRLAEINRVSVEETIGRTVREVIPAWADRIEGLCKRALETERPVEHVEMAGDMGLGLNVIVVADYYPLKNEQGQLLGVNIVVQDITERKRTEEALQASERRLRALLNSIPDMAWLKDNQGRFILVNEPFGMACGKRPEQLIGKTDLDAWPRYLAERYIEDDRVVMHSRQTKRVEEPLAVKHGPERWIETIKTCIVSEQGDVVGTAGIARDITERKRMEEEIRHMAQHDALTGLPNRRLFIDILNLEMAQARRHESKLAVLFLDLDRFKEVNDTLGHEAGDRLLKIVASRLRGAIRESDTVARIGGDEFNVVLSDIVRPEDVSEIARKIVDSVGKPVLIAGHDLHVTASVGISVYPDDGVKVDTLLRYADIAMYHAKESGRNTFRFYNPSINVLSLQRMKLAGYLVQSIKRGELTVLYQPQIDIRSRAIYHAEALVRWNHPDRGMIQPDQFIPLAQETGFIAEIDDWVLRAVCRQARAWKDEGMNSFCVSVNLSARKFQSPDLVALVSSALAESGLPHDCLGLEVTESAVMSNVERTAAQLRELQRMGISISIDDFGTGYSSLSYLKRLPIDRLKIDKSFTRDIASDPDDRAIISAVTSMARKMGIRTVAEGVETEEQLSFLRDSDCDEAQGFLFSRPVPPEQFRALVKAA